MLETCTLQRHAFNVTMNSVIPQEGLLLAGFPQGMQQQTAVPGSSTQEQAGGASEVGSSPSDAACTTQLAVTSASRPSSTDSAEQASQQAAEEREPLSAALNLALRFRLQKKMMLWDVLIAHERSLAERQKAQNLA